MVPTADDAGRGRWSPACGEPDRDLLDPYLRDGVPHLVVRLTEGDAVVGPFVVPGRTACLRCVDAHHAVADVRWPLLVAQQAARTSRLRDDAVPEPVDPALAHLALAWAARDLVQPRGGAAPGVVVGHDPAATGPRRGRGCRLAASPRMRLLVERTWLNGCAVSGMRDNRRVSDSEGSLPRKAFARSARLAALPLGYAGRSAMGLGKRLGGAPAEAVLAEVQQRTAEQLFRTLGELKGGAMKVGQEMSILESALPEEWVAPYRAQLTALQDSAPPMPTQTVRDIIEGDLGPGWRDQLVEFDPMPAAAASIGQVHQGTWADGRQVAVKVQYPGADEALMSDLRQIARLAKTVGTMLPGIDVKPLVEELMDRAATSSTTRSRPRRSTRSPWRSATTR